MIEWFLTTPGGKEYHVDAIDYSYQGIYEKETPRPHECTVTIPRDTPALEKQWMRGEEDGETKFLGFVSRRPSLSGATQSLIGRGCEQLLWHRPCPKLTYSASDTTLNHMFSSNAPWLDVLTDYWQPGLLNAANSLMVPGWAAMEALSPLPNNLEPGIVYGPRWYPDYSNDIVCFRNCGTTSRLGSTDIYHDWHKFDEFSSYADMVASADPSIYRDAQDLWMHLPRGDDIYASDFGFNYGNLFALNAFDTRVRRGTIDLDDTIITDPIKVGPDSQIGDIIGNIATVHEQKIRFRYEKVNGVYYCFMDVVEDFSGWGAVDIYESECSKIDFQADSDLHPDALIGLGNGDRLMQAAYSIFDPKPGRAFIVATEDFDNSFEDHWGNLAPYVDAAWDELREKDIIEVTSDKYDHVFPGQDAILHIENEPPTTYQIASIAQSSAGPSIISIGKRSRDLTDAYRARQSASQVYLIDDLSDVGSYNESGVIGVGDWSIDCVPFVTSVFYMPQYADYSAYNPTTLLEISTSNRENCFKIADCSALIYAEISTDGITYTRLDNSESIQYLLGESLSINIRDRISWGNKNYIRVYCLLNGHWPTERRTLADIVGNIALPYGQSAQRDRDQYFESVWGRYLNKEHYALMVALESDLYAYQIQGPGELVTTLPWYIGDGDKVAKELFYAYKTESGRSKANVLAEIVTPSPAMPDREEYYYGFWGRTDGSGTYVFVIKVETGDMYAYQMQPPGTWQPKNPWSFGTSQQVADAAYASSADGPRTAAVIKAEIDGFAWDVLTTYLHQVRGYDIATYPIAHIVVLDSPNPNAAEPRPYNPYRYAYRMETAEATFGTWKVDEINGDDIIAALLEDYTLEGLRKQSDIRSDISNIEFADPETTYWYRAHGYDLGATPYFDVIQVSNTPQVLAYRRTWVDDEESDWAIDTTSGAAIASQIMPEAKYYDINVTARTVRRRLRA